MASVREAIREASRLSRMRQGQDAPEMVTIPSMDEIRCAMVPLNEAETQSGLIVAASLDVLDNAAGLQARNRAVQHNDVWHSLREPDNLEQKVFQSVDDMVETIQPGDIDFLHDQLSLLMDYASPSIDGLTDADLADLKKAFGETDWSALTGKQWAAVKLCVLNLFPELLQAKLLGSTSTGSATKTSASGAST